MANDIGKLYVDIQADTKGIEKDLKSLGTAGDKAGTTFNNSFTKSIGGLNTRISGIGSAFGAIGLSFAALGAGVVALGANALATAGKFERFKSTLTNALGSVGLATQAMDMLKNISAKTPFELDQITESYIKLVNRGFKPTEAEIIRLGDLASSQGKSFDQLAEALLDAQTGEFERLKEFGVRSVQSGNQVQFTFRGVTTTVNKTDEAIKGYILSLGDLQGIQGSMIAQSDTYEGKLSNLTDSRTNLKDTIGQQFLPVAKEAIGTLTDTINAIDENIKSVVAWGNSTNENVVLVSESFDYLASKGKSILDLAGSFDISMGSILKSALSVIPGLSQVIGVMNQLLSLAGIDIGGLIGGAVNKIKDATGARIKAQTNKLIQDGVGPLSAGLKTQNITNSLQSGLLKLQKTQIPSTGGAPKLGKVGKSGGGGGGTKGKSEAQKEEEKRLKELEELKKKQEELEIKRFETRQKNVQKGRDNLKSYLEKVGEGFSAISDKVKNKIDEISNKIKDAKDEIKDLNREISDEKGGLEKSLLDRRSEIKQQLSNQDSSTDVGRLTLELQKLEQVIGGDKLFESDRFNALSETDKLIELSNARIKDLEDKKLKKEEEVKLLEEQKVAETAIYEKAGQEIKRIDDFVTKNFLSAQEKKLQAVQAVIDKMREASSFNSTSVSDFGATIPNLDNTTLKRTLNPNTNNNQKTFNINVSSNQSVDAGLLSRDLARQLQGL